MSVLLAGFALSAGATDVPANPTNYLNLISTLKPGDTLQLAAGTYTSQLPISGLNGTPCAWITISGPSSGPGAVFRPNACANTVEIKNSNYLAIENLTLDGQGMSGPFGVSANGGTGNLVHDILIEGCTIQNFNGTQQTDGISTKTPTWGWIFRGNQILNAGTGLYLGNSDGSDPFVKGLIEDNFVVDSHRLLHGDQVPGAMADRRRDAHRAKFDDHPQQRLHQERPAQPRRHTAQPVGRRLSRRWPRVAESLRGVRQPLCP
jgi:nitrous oxidase accessory protein NosD